MQTTTQELISNHKIGSDCETFLQDKNTEKIVTAEGIIRGTKKEPFHFDGIDPFYATSLDCVLAEFNIPPCKTAGEFYAAIQKALRYIKSTIPSYLEPVALPAVRMDADQLISEIANEFGCDPSENCWTGATIRPQPTGSNLRSAGFHIHIGYDNPKYDTSRDLMKAMDLYLGIPSIMIEPTNERKSVGYGCAGNWREQKHGGEYRTLSSHFASSKELIEWSFRNTERAIKFINDGRIEEINNLGNDIQFAINCEDKETAQYFIDKFELEVI